MYLFLSYNPRATCCSTLLGGYSLDSLKSNVINTLLSPQMYEGLVPGVEQSIISLKRLSY